MKIILTKLLVNSSWFFIFEITNLKIKQYEKINLIT